MVETDEQVDLSDLDLLDDTRSHKQCRVCQPDVANGEAFRAVCGVRALARRIFPLGHTPPNACPDCRALNACPRCGL